MNVKINNRKEIETHCGDCNSVFMLPVLSKEIKHIGHGLVWIDENKKERGYHCSNCGKSSSLHIYKCYCYGEDWRMYPCEKCMGKMSKGG